MFLLSRTHLENTLNAVKVGGLPCERETEGERKMRKAGQFIGESIHSRGVRRVRAGEWLWRGDP